MDLTFVDFELDQLRSYYSKGGAELATAEELTAYIEAVGTKANKSRLRDNAEHSGGTA